jgi:glycosyltransferase involved in cell wall biosynthesis
MPPSPDESPDRLRLLLVSIVPPKNDCGVRIVMHRHLVERPSFDVYVANAGTVEPDPGVPFSNVFLPGLMGRIRRSRFGPLLRRWLTDFENFTIPYTGRRQLHGIIRDFRPDVILTLAETGWSHTAAAVARQHGIPLAVLFLDWFPIMEYHYGHSWTRPLLSRRFRRLYRECDLAFCTSDGMQRILGPHPNSHVIYPMPGKPQQPSHAVRPDRPIFRIVYVGAAWGFYGRMLARLMEELHGSDDVELRIIAPSLDWPESQQQAARDNGVYLGFKGPDESAPYLAGADALLVVMSFEEEHKLFMQTSFTTKFLDYTAFGKPIILWAPEYCTPVSVVEREGGAMVAATPDAREVADAARRLANDGALRGRMAREASELHRSLFNPDRLQGIFENEILRLAGRTALPSPA